MWGIDVKIIFDTKRNVGMHASSSIRYWKKTVCYLSCTAVV